MDVELLRPGNVPISPNTVLWFEFLLQPDLLEQHLKKANPDPMPSDLLIKFLTLSVEPSVEDLSEKTKNFKCSKRHLSMKVLALKIFAYWKWNLETLESKLPLQLQYVLLRDLLCLLSDDSDQNLLVPTMHHNVNFESLSDEQIFAISLYHRWILHTIVNSPMVSKSVLCNTTANVESADEIMSKIMDDEGRSEIILQKILALKKEYIIVPTFYNFFPPTEYNDLIQDWRNGLKLSTDKFYCQIHYDLGAYKLYRELNNEVVEYFVSCKALYDKFKALGNQDSSREFCEVQEENLKGFCRACGIMLDENRNLTLEFYSAIRNNYANIINVLQADNLKREIPISYRDSLELDLASTLASGKFTATRDLLFQIQTLNAIRRTLEGSCYPSVMDYATKLNVSRKGADILMKALKPLLGIINEEEKQKIRLFLLTLFEKCDCLSVRFISNDKELSSLFLENELKDARTRFDNDNLNLPNLNEEEERYVKKIKKIGNPQLELCALERQIIKTYDPSKLKELISKYSSLPSSRKITSICSKWDVSNGLSKMATNLPSQFLRDFCYVALAKVNELLNLENYTTGLDMIRIADEELKKHGNTNILCKFSQLLLWETLYINMTELQALWPTKNINYQALLISCKKCLLTAHQGGDVSVLPRLQVTELCVITLLNLTEWEYLANNNFQKRFLRYLDLSSFVSLACLDVVKFKGNKKFSKECWDAIVPAFLTSNLQRKQIGQYSDRENPTSVLSKAGLTQYFLKLRDPTVISVILSLLARLHNVLRDEPNLELYFHYTQLWPPNVPNPSAYNPDAVIEVLAEVLDYVSRYHPYNVQWLKLTGDVNFVKRHHSTALKYYFEAVVTSSDYFVRPIPKTLVEDFIYKRMIRCCMELQCFTQAAVLCQFLDEVDYTTAFKCLSESSSSDATDCYYDCIWDVNILEYLISLHTKRNQHSKKQKAIDIVGLLELNSNNNDEIKREASNVRKTKFLRAMSKQYIS